MACNADGQPVQEWKLTDAYPTSYSAAGLAAAGTDVLTETDLDRLLRRAARRPGRPDRRRLGRAGGGR